MFPDIPPSARTKYRYLVERYPNNYENLVAVVPQDEGVNVPPEQAMQICKFIQQQLAVEMDQQASTSQAAIRHPEQSASPTSAQGPWTPALNRNLEEGMQAAMPLFLGKTSRFFPFAEKSKNPSSHSSLEPDLPEIRERRSFSAKQISEEEQQDRIEKLESYVEQLEEEITHLRKMKEELAEVKVKNYISVSTVN